MQNNKLKILVNNYEMTEVFISSRSKCLRPEFHCLTSTQPLGTPPVLVFSGARNVVVKRAIILCQQRYSVSFISVLKYLNLVSNILKFETFLDKKYTDLS